MTTDQALEELFSNTYKDIASRVKAPINTVGAWKNKYKMGKLSFEKQKDILIRFGYKIESTTNWIK